MCIIIATKRFRSFDHAELGDLVYELFDLGNRLHLEGRAGREGERFNARGFDRKPPSSVQEA
jgi:hypothetical protein